MAVENKGNEIECEREFPGEEEGETKDKQAKERRRGKRWVEK